MSATTSHRKRGSQSNPNIVFILADDWGWGDLGSFGHQFIDTPNLDNLARRGTRFTQFYVCSGVCSPSRAAFMTGHFPARHGIHGHFAEHERNHSRGMPNWLEPEVVTYTRILQQQGYAIGHYGKWHLGNGDGAPEPYAYGIDECRINAGNGPQLSFPVVDTERRPFFTATTDDMNRGGPRTKSSQVIVDESISFVNRHRNEPFLLNVWLNDTHATLDPDRDQLERYEHLMPDGVMHKHVGANAVYAATVSEADRQIGRLLQHLDDMGLTDNTIVIFTADNGPEDIVIGNSSHSGVGSPGPFRGRKRSLYEGGIRVPFIISWPEGGVRAGAVDNSTPLCSVDFLPTFAEMTGATLPSEHIPDGESMVDVFHGSERERNTPLFWEWRFQVYGHVINRSPILAVREAQWMLLFNPDGTRVELYDVPEDPLELNNQAERRPELVEAMKARALKWQASLPPGPFEESAGSNSYPWPEPYEDETS